VYVLKKIHPVGKDTQGAGGKFEAICLSKASTMTPKITTQTDQLQKQVVCLYG